MTIGQVQEVRLSLRPSRQAIGRTGGGVHFLLRAEPPAAPLRAERRPVALALVIDRSGSMGEPAAETKALPRQPARRVHAGDTGRPDKLGFVKAATLHLLDLMHDGDAVALVAFDDKVQVVKPLTVLDDRSRRDVAAAVRAIETGGSTYLEGGLRAGLEQLTREARSYYGCKLVLLSDGEANVGEQRAAVLAEVTAGAAHNGITTSSLGVGFDYNIALMTALSEAGNGDFSHIHGLEALDELLREEFTTAAEVTARGVEIAIELPERLAFGSNLNSYRQETTDTGFTVFLGDLVRPKEFLFEVTTPVPLDGDSLTVRAHAAYRDRDDVQRRATTQVTIRVCPEEEALTAAVDHDVISKLLVQLPAQVEMQTMLAYEAGEFRRASAAIGANREAMHDVQRLYGPAVAGRMEMLQWESKLLQLDAGTTGRTFDAAETKMRYAASHLLSRARNVGPTM
jgi:Ca-activated chloride channel family protein